MSIAERLSYNERMNECTIKIISGETHTIQKIRERSTYHPSRIIMISMDSEHRQANIEMWVFIVYVAKSGNATCKLI